MTAQCSICGLLVGAEGVGSEAEKFAAASFACFLHLLQHHPEHVKHDINPLIGLVANYTASLAFEAAAQEWRDERESALRAILDLLSRACWDSVQKRFDVRDAHTPNTPIGRSREKTD